MSCFKFNYSILFLLFLLSGECSAESVIVTRVIDGDTIIVNNENDSIRVRLYGVDCPEKKQGYGLAAQKITMRFLPVGKRVQLIPVNTDRYGRTVGLLILSDNSSVNERLIEEGAAWVFNQYCHKPECESWREAEEKARTEGRGLWKEKAPISPWVWRKKVKTDALKKGEE